jgi:hypothetical protein
MRPAAIAMAALLAAAGCAEEAHPVAHGGAEPPVTAVEAIPDAPVSGMLRGARFTMKNARYVADHRQGYTHTDIRLSAASAEAGCGELAPKGAAEVWLRLERSDKVETAVVNLAPGQASPWSVHYQVREGDAWVGSGDAAALVVLREAGPDGKISGGLAVCFADGAKSCVSGSFEAEPCPPGIDAPVRGALPPEAIPERYRQRMRDGGAP